MSARRAEWTVARDKRSVNGFSKRDVDAVVRREVVAQRPYAKKQIGVRIALKVEDGEIRESLRGSASRDLSGAHQTPKTLRHFDVDEMGCMEPRPASKEPRLDARAERGLQQELDHRRRIDHDHADSRSSRMMTAAGVVNVTGVRP